MGRKREEPEGPVTVRCILVGSDGTEYEMTEGYEDRLPPEVRASWDLKRSVVIGKLLDSFAEGDTPLGQAIRLYRSIPGMSGSLRLRPICFKRSLRPR